MSSVANWDDDYARLARAVAQLRTSGGSAVAGPSREHQISSIRAGLDRLNDDLRTLENSRAAPPAEVGRRRALVEGLRGQMDSSSTIGGGTGSTTDAGAQGGAGYGQQRMTASSAMRTQDNMIDELSAGVGRLRDQSNMIHDEARLHNRLLDEMDADVDLARAGMEDGALRAQKVREDRSLWRLYMIIAGLSVLLFFLILMGLS